MTWEKIKNSVKDTMRNTGMIFAILIGALLFNVFLTISNIPMLLAETILDFDLPSAFIISIMVLIYLFLGCFIDAMAMVLLTIPIFYPIILTLGIDPVLFGIIVVIVVEMAMITPPVGMNIFAIGGIIDGAPMETVFKGAMPFVGVIVAFIFLLVICPEIALFLPNFFGM